MSSLSSDPVGALHVRVSGTGDRTFLLIHGLAGSHRYFGAGFDELARYGRLVAPDLLGFGASPRPPDSVYDAEAHARALIEALERLGIQGPVHVVAHSAGCLVALRLARLRPEWVSSVIGISPPFYSSPDAARTRIGGLGFMVRWFALDTGPARLVCEWMCRHRALAARLARWLRPDLPPQIAEDGVQHSWLSYSATVRNLLLGAEPRRELQEISSPVLLIAGDHDRAMDLPFLEQLVRTHSHVSLEVWSGGHDLPLAEPGRLVGTVLRFTSASVR